MFIFLGYSCHISFSKRKTIKANLERQCYTAIAQSVFFSVSETKED